MDKVKSDNHVTVLGVYNAREDNDSTILDTYVNVRDINSDVERSKNKLSASDIQGETREYVEDK